MTGDDKERGGTIQDSRGRAQVRTLQERTRLDEDRQRRRHVQERIANDRDQRREEESVKAETWQDRRG